MSGDHEAPMDESSVPDSTAGMIGFIRAAQRRTTAERLASPRDRVSLDAMLGEAERFSVELTRSLRGESTLHEKIACAAGCGWCCHVQVAISAAEAIRVADHLRSTLDGAALQSVRSRVADLDERTRGLSREQRADTRLPCALLVDFSCSVHPARPLRCRSWNSLDVERCKVEHATPRSGHLEIENIQWETTRAVAAGLADGIRDSGLGGEKLELTAALRIALENPDAEIRWRSGESLFAAAILP